MCDITHMDEGLPTVLVKVEPGLEGLPCPSGNVLEHGALPKRQSLGWCYSGQRSERGGPYK